MISSLYFFLSESKYIELELVSEGFQGGHEVGGAPPTLVASSLHLRLHLQVFWFAFGPRKIMRRFHSIWTRRRPWSKRVGPEESRAAHEGGRHAHPPGRALHPRGPLVAPMTYFFLLYIPIYPKTIGEQNRSGVPPPQASVATKNQSGPCSGTLTEGGNPHRWPSSSSRRSP